MTKKMLLGALVTFIGLGLIGFLVHGVILASAYQAEPFKSAMRPASEMMKMLWIYYAVYAIQALFFSFIFFKGYEGKGIIEGVRYGFYMGMLMATPMAFASYAMLPMPYSLAFQWFIYGIIEFVILGILLAAIAGKKTAQT